MNKNIFIKFTANHNFIINRKYCLDILECDHCIIKKINIHQDEKEILVYENNYILIDNSYCENNFFNYILVLCKNDNLVAIKLFVDSIQKVTLSNSQCDDFINLENNDIFLQR